MAGSVVDPSIELGIHSEPVNPLSILGSVTTIGNAMQENKLLRQRVGTNQAVSDAMKQSVDPTTGQVDSNKLMSIVAQDPRAQAGLPEIMSNMQAYRTNQFNLAKSHLDNMSGRISSLLSSPPGSLDQKTVLGAMGQLVAEGMISPKEFAVEASGMPSDEPGIRQFLTTHLNRTLDSATRLTAIFGSPTSINTGGQTITANVSPETGVHQTGTINNTLSPEAAATPTQIGTVQNGANKGAPIQGTEGQFIQEATGAAPPCFPIHASHGTRFVVCCHWGGLGAGRGHGRPCDPSRA